MCYYVIKEIKMKKNEVCENAVNEKIINDLEYEFVKKFINIRKKNKLTQQEMAEKSGVIRETIARIETQITSPQIKTLLRILQPLGYTVKIVAIPKKK